MEKKKYNQTPEQNKVKKTCQIQFNSEHFGDKKKPIGTQELVGELNEWWDNNCSENGLDPKDDSIHVLGYQVIELCKNAFEHAHGGEISVIFEPDKIIVIVSDQGVGFDDQEQMEYYFSIQGHGLSGIKEYADELTVETSGAKYTKVAGE